jgi:hypothetical protein
LLKPANASLSRRDGDAQRLADRASAGSFAALDALGLRFRIWVRCKPVEAAGTGKHAQASDPKSARSRHSENFLATFANNFEEHGAQVIEQVRRETPAIYLKIAADLLPKEATLDLNVDIVHRAQSQLEAFRLLRDAIRIEIEVLKSQVDDEEAVG